MALSYFLRTVICLLGYFVGTDGTKPRIYEDTAYIILQCSLLHSELDIVTIFGSQLVIATVWLHIGLQIVFSRIAWGE